MIGAVPVYEYPFSTYILRFLLELDTMRNSRRRADPPLETAHTLKLVLRAGILLPPKKIEDAVEWLINIQTYGGWNRQAYQPPTPYMTAIIADVLCDYIAYTQFRLQTDKLLYQFVFGPGEAKPQRKEDVFVRLWDAVEVKPSIPVVGVSVDLKKAAQQIRKLIFGSSKRKQRREAKKRKKSLVRKFNQYLAKWGKG